MCIGYLVCIFYSSSNLYISRKRRKGKEGKERKERKGRREWVVCDEGDLLYMLVFYNMIINYDVHVYIFVFIYNLFLLKPICIIIEYIFTVSNKIIFKYNLFLPMQNMNPCCFIDIFIQLTII